jgi:hypothetical protein
VFSGATVGAFVVVDGAVVAGAEVVVGADVLVVVVAAVDVGELALFVVLGSGALVVVSSAFVGTVVVGTAVLVPQYVVWKNTCEIFWQVDPLPIFVTVTTFPLCVVL